MVDAVAASLMPDDICNTAIGVSRCPTHCRLTLASRPFCEKELGCMFTASSLIKPPAYAPVPSALSFCAGKLAPRYQGIERCDFDGSWDGTGPLAGAPTQ